MAIQQPGLSNGLCKANADLSAHQFKFVRVTAADFTVDLNSVNNGQCLGVLQDKPKAGEPANVMVDGVSKLKLGGPVAIGGLISSTAAGLGQAATGVNTVVQAMALEAGVLNDIIAVQLIRCVLAS